MNEVKKYAYTDWWNGEICFLYSIIVYDPKDEKKIPPRVSWDEINKPDGPKIKKKQGDIFRDKVSETMKIWKVDFSKRYKNSKLPTLLLNSEIEKFEGFMYDPIPYSNDSQIVIRGIAFSLRSISAIKNYINNTKVNGAAIEFDFIHSPNFQFQNKAEIPPQIYAECCWLYVRWLRLHLKQKKQKQKALASVLGNDKIQEGIIPSNPFPNIFTNGYAYNMFLELQKLTVSRKSMAADYGFIFFKMKKHKAIPNSLTHRSFIEFLNANNYAEFKIIKLPFKNPFRKQATLSSLLAKYEESILKIQPR